MNKILQSAHLHPLIYIIADKPTKDNISQQIPLVGTSSYRTLLGWIGIMDIDITRVRLYNQVDGPFNNIMAQTSLNRAIQLRQICVIALGQKAATYLRKAGIQTYSTLPHPSGRNRVLNDRTFVKGRLDSCKKFVYEGVNDAS